MGATPPAGHPITHVESGRKKLRVATMKNALEAKALNLDQYANCAVKMIEFNATSAALKLLGDPLLSGSV